MVQRYPKGVKIPVSKSFFTTDFDCKCTRAECTFTLLDDRIPPALEAYKEHVGDFQIDSAFRCPKHNEEEGGVDDSQHPKGTAVDCKSKVGKTGIEMAKGAESIQAFAAGGIGTYKTFAHVDVRNKRARWDYSRHVSQACPE